MDVRVGPQRRLSAKELMLLNCGAREDYLESHGQQGDQASQSYRKSTLKFIEKSDAEALILWPHDTKC